MLVVLRSNTLRPLLLCSKGVEELLAELGADSSSDVLGLLQAPTWAPSWGLPGGCEP